MNAFAIGEFAIVAFSNMPEFPVGSEVLIESIVPCGRPLYAIGEVIRSGRTFAVLAEERELRKRRPPQDWERLCNLDVTEDEVTA